MTEKNKIEGISALGANTSNYDYSKPSIDILEVFKNQHPDNLYLVPFLQTRDEFTSCCPITRQPDQARMEIIYVPDKLMIESKSLKLYLFSFRNHGEFHEDVTNRIAKSILEKTEAYYVRIFADFAPRGGIAIKPIVELWGQKEQKEQIHDAKTRITSLVNAWDFTK